MQRIIYLGWEVQVELRLEDGQQVMSYVSRDRFDQLKLQPQQQVYVKPKQAKSFALKSA